jgi:hypothetical protein
VKVCPYCAEELADDVVVCTHCGRDTSEGPAKTTTPPQPVVAPSAEEIVRASAEQRVLGAGAGAPARAEPISRKALAAFGVVAVVGVLGSAVEIPPGAAVTADLVALGLGVGALTSSRRSRGTGLAAAAVVLAILGLIGYGRHLI